MPLNFIVSRHVQRYRGIRSRMLFFIGVDRPSAIVTCRSQDAAGVVTGVHGRGLLEAFHNGSQDAFVYHPHMSSRKAWCGGNLQK